MLLRKKIFTLFCFDIISSEFRLFYNDFGNLIEVQKFQKIKNLVVIKLYPKKVISNSTDIYQKKVYDQIHKFNIKKILIFCSVKKLWKLTK